MSGIVFDPFAQPADHHVHAAVESVVLAAARGAHQLVAGQRLPRPLHQRRQRRQHREFAGGHAQFVAVATQRARGKIQHAGAERDLAAVRPRRDRRGPAAA